MFLCECVFDVCVVPQVFGSERLLQRDPGPLVDQHRGQRAAVSLHDHHTLRDQPLRSHEGTTHTHTPTCGGLEDVM